MSIVIVLLPLPAVERKSFFAQMTVPAGLYFATYAPAFVSVKESKVSVGPDDVPEMYTFPDESVPSPFAGESLPVPPALELQRTFPRKSNFIRKMSELPALVKLWPPRVMEPVKVPRRK